MKELFEALVRFVQRGAEIETNGMLVPAGVEVRAREQYKDKPSRFRGQYETSSLADFIRYVEACDAEKKREGIDDDTRIFVDPKCRRAKAIFRFGSPNKPEWRDWTASLEMELTEDYKMLNEAVASSPLHPLSFVDVLENLSPNVDCLDRSFSVIPLDEAIHNIRDVTIESIRRSRVVSGDYTRERSEAEKMAMKGSSLPYKVVSTFPLLKGLDVNIGVTVGIRAKEVSGSPRFDLRYIRHARTKEIMATAFYDDLKKGVKKTAVIYEGAHIGNSGSNFAE